MSDDSDTPTLFLFAGQISEVPVEFLDEDGEAVDLTGSTIYLSAKAEFGDAVALIESQQDTHADGAGGLSTFPVDLSEAPESWFTKGIRLIASVWIVDGAGQVIPQGNLAIQVQPSNLPRVTP